MKSETAHYDKLTRFEKWMAKSQLNYIKDKGLSEVVNNLRAQGYDRVANAVEELAKKQKDWK